MVSTAALLWTCTSGTENKAESDTLEIAQDSLVLPETHIVEEISYQPKIDALNGTHYCYIKKLYHNKNRYFIDADLIEFFRGEAAVEAARKDGGAETRVDANGDTVYSVLNDYYVVNKDENVSTFEIGDKASIKLWLFNDDGEMVDGKGLEDLKKKDFKFSPFILELKDGTVGKVAEQYVP